MAEFKESHRYDDIIHKPHPVSSRHAAMTNRDRAAQFSPFAALTGYEEVITEASRPEASGSAGADIGTAGGGDHLF